MYSTERLSSKNLEEFKKLNSKRTDLNQLNEDFFNIYDRSNMFGRFLLRKKVILIRTKEKYIGYIWFTNTDKSRAMSFVNSLFIDEDYINEDLSGLLSSLNNFSTLCYDCVLTEESTAFLKQLGFIQKNGTFELLREITEKENIECSEETKFVKFIKGRHERLRCSMQNEIFHSNQRDPLTIKDIYLDELQDYYVNDWCVFLQLKDNYIGYGQIIMNNSTPLIVNFGIKEKYRGKGFGDLLLSYLLNILYEAGYKEVKIKVNTSNLAAYNLYIKKGFKKSAEYYTWYKITN